MNTFRQIPLHMLLLAGLIGTAEAKDKEPASSAAKPAAAGVAYAGLNVGPRDEAVASVPAGVGIVVGFIDPKGPSVGKIEEGDILTRLDDQVLFNAEQFPEKGSVEKLPADVRRRLQLVEGRGFSLPGNPGAKPAGKPAAEEPKKKFDPKQGA
jgi:hypothetical protein